jgi:hypothetical protein
MEGIAKSRWEKLDSKRSTLLDRCRVCTSLTIPHLLPPRDLKETDQLKTPYQGLGARAVNNLSAKLLLTLMPPNSAFYRLDVDPEVLLELKEQMGDQAFKTKIEEALATHEKMGVKLVERNAYRVQMFRVLRLLISTGNALIEMPTKSGKPAEGRLKVHRLDKYIIRRGPEGSPLEIIIREVLSPEEIPEGIDYTKDEKKDSEDEEIELFTHAKRSGDRWHVHQEILGQEVPDTMGVYKEDNFPLLPLTWTLAEGENYGRGHVEEHLGDFMSLDGLSQALLEGAAAMAKVIFLISTNGTTNQKDLMKTPNGGFANGRKEDVTVLQAEKYADFKVAHDESLRIERRLANSFLLNDSVQRQAERVTATEIRLMAQELEDALGGVYSVLSQELQYPLAVRILTMLPKLPAKVAPTIVTGFEALGRGHDLQKLESLIEHIKPIGEQALQTWLQVDDYIARVCVALGIDKSGLITSREEVEAAAQAQQKAAMMEKIAPQLAGSVADQAAGGDQTGGQ